MSVERKAILDRPVMIIGSARSGTTWLQKMLLCHPEICGGQESHFFSYATPLLNTYAWHMGLYRGVGLPAYITEEKLIEIIRNMWHEAMGPLVNAYPDARVLLDKTPLHAFHIPQIERVLPDARCIFMVRDSRGVVASLLAASRDHWGRRWAPRTAAAAARRWKQLNHTALRDLNMLPAHKWTLCHYEHLAANTAPELKRLLEFIGVEVTDERIAHCINSCQGPESENIKRMSFYFSGAHADKHNTPEPAGFVRPGGPDKWRTELNWLQKQLIWWKTRKLMKKLGYDRAGHFAL